MAYRYSDDMYSNSSRSSRSGGGTWVYMNGELYHEGKPGMRWGFHLPGTDWWKRAKNVGSYYYNKSIADQNKANSTGSGMLLQQPSKVKAVGSAVRGVASMIGHRIHGSVYTKMRKLQNRTNSFIQNSMKNLRDTAKKFFISSGNKFLDDIKKRGGTASIGDGFLDSAMIKEAVEMTSAHKNALENGGIFNIVNSFIQSAQSNVVVGINSYMSENNRKENVNAFLKKLGIKFKL